MLLVYTHKITPRVTYTFKHICARILGLKVSFTSKVEDFVAHDGPKLSYTHKQLGNELHISAVDLLFEQGVMDVEIQLQVKSNRKDILFQFLLFLLILVLSTQH